jgi:hypothetical protein
MASHQTNPAGPNGSMSTKHVPTTKHGNFGKGRAHSGVPTATCTYHLAHGSMWQITFATAGRYTTIIARETFCFADKRTFYAVSQSTLSALHPRWLYNGSHQKLYAPSLPAYL